MKRSQIRSFIRATANTPQTTFSIPKPPEVKIQNDIKINETAQKAALEIKVRDEYRELVDKLSYKFDTLNGVLADIPRKNDRFSVPLYKAVLEGLNKVKESVDNKPVPHWQWPQYAAVSVRDKNFANINPAVAYQNASTTESAPYGTLPVFDNAGTIAKVSNSVGLPVNVVSGSLTITSSTLSGLQVNLTKATTSVLSGVKVFQSGSYDTSYIDSNNTSTATLAGNASFTGTGTDITNAAYIHVLIFSDQSSASNGVKLEFSNDNTNWDDASLYTFTAGGSAPNAGQTFGASPRARYFRVVYTNGSSAQSAFRLQTIIKKHGTPGDMVTMVDVPNSTNHALLTKASIVGKTTAGGGSFVDVKVNPSGALSAAVTAADGDVFVRSNAASTFPVTIGAATTSVLAGTKLEIERWTAGTANLAGLKTFVENFPTTQNVSITGATTSTLSGVQVVLNGSKSNIPINIAAATTSTLAGIRVFQENTPTGTQNVSIVSATTSVLSGVQVVLNGSKSNVPVNIAAATTSTLAGLKINLVQLNGTTVAQNSGNLGVTINNNAASAGHVDIAQVAGSTVATVATGVQKVGIADSAGTGITSTGSALDINLKSATTSVLAGVKVLGEGIARSSEITAVANGATVAAVYDLVGKQIVLPYANPENFINGTSKFTGVASSTIIAGVASTRLYITSLIVTNTSSTNTFFKIQDGSGGATLLIIPAPGNSGAVVPLPAPIKTTAGNGLFALMGTSLTTAYISAVGYKGV